MWPGTAETVDDAHSKSCFFTTAVSLTLHVVITRRLYPPAEDKMIATDLNRVKSRTNHFSDDIQQTRVRPQAPYHDPILRLRRTSTCQLDI